jgi:hypothetical protein
MKKITAILLAMGLSVSAFTALTACDNTDTEVTKEEFLAAFTLGENYVCKADAVYEGMGIERWQFKRSGNLFESCVEMLNPDYTPFPGDAPTYNYVEQDGEKVYYYSPTIKEDGVTVDFYRKEERTESFEDLIYEDLGALFLSPLLDLDLYTYNAETQAYEAAEVPFEEGSGVKDVSWKFVDNKLVACSYVMISNNGEAEMRMPISFTITYGNATVVLPTNVQ